MEPEIQDCRNRLLGSRPEEMTMGDRPRLAILGTGKMGATLLEAVLGRGPWQPEEVIATGRREAPLKPVAEKFGVRTTLDNPSAVRESELVLVCVKPQNLVALLAEISPELGPGHTVISIAAGATTEAVEAALGQEVAVVRAMPNTPVRAGAGMTAICAGRWAGEEHLERARSIFDTAGRTLALSESYLDAVTGLSASGPAFIYIVIESLAEGGVKAGLPRGIATELAAQTCLGAASMVLQSGSHPALLKDDVTTPAGCTMDGILALEEGGLRVTLIKAVTEATRRAGELMG
jgi:pyrroline-5-carboxylate reductase